jgi:hypothetical protein
MSSPTPTVDYLSVATRDKLFQNKTLFKDFGADIGGCLSKNSYGANMGG